MSGEARRVPLHFCIECDQPLDTVRALLDNPDDVEGCVSVCVYCGLAGIFEKDGSVRKMSLAEWADLAPETQQDIVNTQDAIRRVNIDNKLKQIRDTRTIPGGKNGLR